MTKLFTGLSDAAWGSHQHLLWASRPFLQLAFIISLSIKAKDSLRMKKAEILHEKNCSRATGGMVNEIMFQPFPKLKGVKDLKSTMI